MAPEGAVELRLSPSAVPEAQSDCSTVVALHKSDSNSSCIRVAYENDVVDFKLVDCWEEVIRTSHSGD